MRDIARVAGVSQSTVSRILNGVPLLVPVAEQTRERVLAAAAELGYRPNPLARALRGARTMLLGVVVRDITDPFFASAIEALSRSARSHGYGLVLGNAQGRAEEAVALAAVLESRQCDALVLLGDVSDQPRLANDLRDSHVPVVALWQGSARHDLPSVNVDNERGIQLAVEHLAGLGHRRIAFVEGRRLGDIRERELAFSHHMERLGLEVPDGFIRHGPNTPAGGATALRTLLRKSPRPTAVVTSTDVLAFGVLHAAHLLGVTVPEALSVVGFDDIPLAAHAVPALTTVRMPTAEMVEAAVAIAIADTTDGSPPAPAAFVPELIVRKSTGRLSNH
jgi:DNA-binding LacI/PurR family transcriptional regulator